MRRLESLSKLLGRWVEAVKSRGPLFISLEIKCHAFEFDICHVDLSCPPTWSSTAQTPRSLSLGSGQLLGCTGVDMAMLNQHCVRNELSFCFSRHNRSRFSACYLLLLPFSWCELSLTGACETGPCNVIRHPTFATLSPNLARTLILSHWEIWPHRNCMKTDGNLASYFSETVDRFYSGFLVC